MSSPAEAPQGLSPDDALPPVEPPSAGFILQLFVVPAIIVFIIVMIWWMFNWLAQRGNDPRVYVEALKRNNESRWQAAVNLANALRSDTRPSRQSIKQDEPLARDLAAMLERELADGGAEENAVMLRIYLCRALGEFAVTDGLPVLLKAAETERDPREREVRQAALQAIAVLDENIRRFRPAARGEVESERTIAVLIKATDDPDPLVRSAATFTLGVVGGKTATARLKQMLHDPYPDVRYNAATGLARHGDAGAIEVLEEMLDLEQQVGVNLEKEDQSREFKRAMIVVNALEATSQLARSNPKADIARLEKAIERVRVDSHVARNIRLKAAAVLDQLKQDRAKRTARIPAAAD